MKTEIRFKHMDRSEALEQFAISRIEPIVDEFLKRHDYHMQVWLVAEHGRNNRGVPTFICEVDVRYPPKHDVFIQKANSDMYQAIHAAMDALKIKMREISKKEIQSRQALSRVATAR